MKPDEAPALSLHVMMYVVHQFCSHLIMMCSYVYE